MDVSVIVCTYNRANSLRETLQALKAQHLPASCECEIIVVDNNSKDATRQVVAEMQHGWPQLRYEFEGHQGLSHARNHGITVAQGEFLLFTDDDVLPEPDWIEETIIGLKKHNAIACGGYVAPIWESPPPDWLTERFYGFLAIRNDRTDDHLITEAEQTPFGANMAFNKHVFNQVGFFDTSRGRKGSNLASGEDGELFERIRSAGLKIVFLGKSRVHHKVESFRLTKQYFRRWRYQTSHNLAISRGVPGNKRIVGIPLYVFPQAVRAVWRMAIGYLFSAKDEAFNRDMVVQHFLGLMSGLYAARHRKP